MLLDNPEFFFSHTVPAVRPPQSFPDDQPKHLSNFVSRQSNCAALKVGVPPYKKSERLSQDAFAAKSISLNNR